MSDDDIEIAALANQRPGGQQAGMYIPPIVAFQRSTGYAFVVHEVERSQFKTAAKAKEQLGALIAKVRAHRAAALTSEEIWSLKLAREVMSDIMALGYRERSERAVATLDKLIAAAGGAE